MNLPASESNQANKATGDSGREREILFGLIALQTGFIDLAKLRECLQVWKGKPSAAMESLLGDMAQLGPAELAAIRQLADVQAARQAGSSLDGLHLPHEVRATLLSELGAETELTSASPDEDSMRAVLHPFTLTPDDRYQLGAELGRGGLGKVLVATDRTLGRQVALKLLLDGASREQIARFSWEGRVTGRLDHPNIVPVHDLGILGEGSDAGQIYISMKRICGIDMRHVIAELRQARHKGFWNRRRLVEALRDVCRAIAFAHSRAVLHRDLKPANIMLGDYGEVLVVDWGLAKLLNEDEGLAEPSLHQQPRLPEKPWMTVEGVVMGTPSYMSPEQASGVQSEIGYRSDVYALGAILFEILAYRPPFRGDSPLSTVMQVLRGLKTGPRERRAQDDEADAMSLPEALVAICLKAMSRDKEARYPDARSLEDDLTAFLDGIKEREMLVGRADRSAQEGTKLSAELVETKEGLQEQMRRLTVLNEEIPDHAGIERKRPLWDAEARYEELTARVTELFAAADAAFRMAIGAVPEHFDGRSGLCALHLARYMSAEAMRDKERMLLSRRVIVNHDPGGWTKKLEPRGRLSITTMRYDCSCLEPVEAEAWNPKFSDDCPVAWEDGRPEHGMPPAEDHFPVPRLELGRGQRWGHRDDCSQHPIEARVRLYRYRPKDRRLIPRFVRELPPTPFAEIELEGGSYLLRVEAKGFAAMRVPVRIDRDGHWQQTLRLYPEGIAPQRFDLVAGGPFLHGIRGDGRVWRNEVQTRDFFIARYLVTVEEYIVFLNDLPIEEARARQPREGDLRYLKEEDDRFRVRRSEEDRKIRLTARCPIIAVSWEDARRYSEWISKREGRLLRLIHTYEYEKAGRGVDARLYPWGDKYDGTYSNTGSSYYDRPAPSPVGAFAVDESPYGAVDMAGNACSWCLNQGAGSLREHYYHIRGGAWNQSPEFAQVPERGGALRTRVSQNLGFRLCMPCVSYRAAEASSFPTPGT